MTAVTRDSFRSHPVNLEVIAGNEHLGKCLVIHPRCTGGDIRQGIMMREFEKEGIQQEIRNLCHRYHPARVLEVGFGMGFTATQFQECGIEKHVIVEAHPQMAADARQWRENYPTKDIEIVEEFFQDYLYNEENYDLIYDDRFEMIDHGREYREYLRTQGFMFRENTNAFPCWKIVVDRTKK
tara:strand:+ start:827 stop:1372 length:546 start_codon:yes stop_codon:yes gene_type:complete